MTLRNFKIGLLILSFIAAFISYNNYEFTNIIPILPLSFTILFCIVIPNNLYIGAGFFTACFVMVIRYVIHPIMLAGDNYQMLGNKSYIPIAMIYMIYEMVVILLTFRVFGSRKNTRGNNTKNYKVTLNWVLPSLSIIIYILIHILYPETFSNQRWIWQSSRINEQLIETNGYLLVLANITSFLSTIFIFGLLYKKYVKTNNKLYYYFSLLIIFLPCISYSGHSRLSVLIPIISFIFFIRKVYGKTSNKIVILTCIYCIFSVILLSLYKATGDVAISNVNTLTSSGLLNVYFGGIDNVVIGIETYYNNTPSFIYFLIDSFRNIMGISHMFEGIPSTLDFFNGTFYQQYTWESLDQIPPTVYQGLMYFGNILCVIPTFIMTWSICRADTIFAKTNNPYIAYLTLSFVIMVAWALPGCYMHFTTRLFNNLIPLYLVYKANQLIKV